MGLRWMSIGIGAGAGADHPGVGDVGCVVAPGQGGVGMDILRWARWVDWWVITAGGIFCGWVAGQKGHTGMSLAYPSPLHLVYIYKNLNRNPIKSNIITLKTIEESLLILRNLGIQTRTCPSSTFSPMFFLAPIASLLAPLVLPPLRLLTAPLNYLPAAGHVQCFQGKTNPPPPPFYLALLSYFTLPFFWSSYTPRGTTRFIPTSLIQDVWIHEGFVGFEVRYFLGVVVKGEDEIVVVFPRTLPGRRVAEVVWRGLRGCLYEGSEAKA